MSSDFDTYGLKLFEMLQKTYFNTNMYISIGGGGVTKATKYPFSAVFVR